MNKKPLSKTEFSGALLSLATSPSYAQTMTRTVNISEAKANLSKLADEVASGEEVIVSRAGKPVMKLVPIITVPTDRVQTNRKLGFAADLLTDFSWEEWEASHDEFRKLFRDYQDFK
jgi:prevent-host-death family protein